MFTCSVGQRKGGRTFSSSKSGMGWGAVWSVGNYFAARFSFSGKELEFYSKAAYFRPTQAVICHGSGAALAQLVRALDCGSRGPLFNPGRLYHPPLFWLSFLPACGLATLFGFIALMGANAGLQFSVRLCREREADRHDNCRDKEEGWYERVEHPQGEQIIKLII